MGKDRRRGARIGLKGIFVPVERKPIANASLVLREEFDDWALLFDPDTGKAVGLDPVGVCIWKLLDGEHTEEAILGKIREDFDEVPADADVHLREFIEALMARGWVGTEVEEM